MSEEFGKYIKANFAVAELMTFTLAGKIIGKLIIKDKKLEFIGDADKSAVIFFNTLKPYINNYINEKLGMNN